MNSTLKFAKRLVTKTLRVFQGIAHKSCQCDTCGEIIIPGEQYQGFVCVRGRKLWVSKDHFPYCPDLFNEDYDVKEDKSKKMLDIKVA